MNKRTEREEARNLYRNGHSYNEIVDILKASKSTVSLWCRDLVAEKRALKTKEIEQQCGGDNAPKTAAVKPEKVRIGIPAQHPYEGFSLYSYVAKGGARHVLLSQGRKRQHALTYARYLMSCHLGRILSPDELVGHRDDDPTNDALENLEITTRSEKAKKLMRKRFPVVVKECVICETKFTPLRRSNETCSKKCKYDLIALVLMDRARS